VAPPRIVVEDATGELLAGPGPVVFGTRTGCDVVVDDAIAAARHCEFAHDGAFTVRDLGSVSGTWVDGESVRAPSELRSGSQVVFGTSRVLVEIEPGDSPTLRLKLQRQGFWWRKAGKKVFDNDPDALVRAEVGFGNFPALRVGNRAALILGGVLLLASIFVASVLEPLADAGPLHPFHAQVTSGAPVAGAHADFARCQALADAQGCNVCHEGGGIPHTKCLQCHPSLLENGGAHPYLGDGVLGTSTNMPVEGFCTVCHTDHQGDDWLKPAAASLVGNCPVCHGTEVSRAELEARSQPQLPPRRQRAFASYRFPHASHVGKGFDCAVCHRVDGAVAAARSAGIPDDPLREDFAEVPYETCAACHVPGAAAVAGMSATQQAEWRAKDHQWNVTWHGTDGGGAKCAQCHAQGQREGRVVFGPEMKTVPRPVASAEQYAAERARYVSGSRRHGKEFEDHAQGQACTVCHKSGGIADLPASVRPFWHALHVVDGALQPTAGAGGGVSSDAKVGCVSCHGDLAGSNALRDASVAAYHWPDTPAAQAACVTCHAEGGKPLPLQARSTTIAAERRGVGIAFPHDVHVAAASFGKSGSLAEGCFACHEFTPANGDALQLVPRTRPGAADCTSCHTGHADLGGGECQQCHTVDRAVASSFQLAAAIAAGTAVDGKPAPPPAMRSWPGQNTFSHLSRGHVEVACAECHDPAAIAKSDALGNVPIPDDATKACRDCHLQKQFHWR
jgi:hypothetical protein